MKLNIDKQTLEKIGLTLANELNPVFSPMLVPNNQIIKSTDVKELGDWFVQAGKGRDGLLSKVAYSLIKNLMAKLPQEYIQVSIKEIEIDTTSAEPGAKFSPYFKLKTVKPYVEIQLWVSGVKTKVARVTFEIKFDGKFNDMEIKKEKGLTRLCLGQFVSNVTASLVKIPFVSLDKPRTIRSKEITVDLSQYCVKI